MIVKVQRSQFPLGLVLIYNKDCSVYFESEMPKDLSELMGDMQKAYFEAFLDKDGMLNIGKLVEWQDW